MAKAFLYCEETDTKIHSNDIVSITTYPNTKWLVKNGWYKIGTAQKHGWYFISLIDKTILPIEHVDIKTIINNSYSGSVEGRPELPKEDHPDLARDFLYCEETETKIYPNDIIEISGTKYVVKYGYFRIDNEIKQGWHYISLEDRKLFPDNALDLTKAIKEEKYGTSELRPTLLDMDTPPAKVDFIVIPNTDIRLYDGDIVKIDTQPDVKWIVHMGWYIYDEIQNFGWYFVSILNGEILPVSIIDLTLCNLETVKTQGSEIYDGKVVNYTRPFTVADAEVIKRAFITVDTLEQRDNLDKKKLVNGKLVRVNYVGGVANYYAWNAETQTWDKVDWGGGGSGGIPELEGTYSHPIILSQIEQGLYRVIGVYKITPDSELTVTNIDHLIFTSGFDPTAIKIITESSIMDYLVIDGEITFSNEYATKHYVDNKITLIERQISEIIQELPDMIDARIDALFEPIPDFFIYSLFNL